MEYADIGKAVSDQLRLYDETHMTRYNAAFDYAPDYTVLGECVDVALKGLKKSIEHQDQDKQHKDEGVKVKDTKK